MRLEQWQLGEVEHPVWRWALSLARVWWCGQRASKGRASHGLLHRAGQSPPPPSEVAAAHEPRRGFVPVSPKEPRTRSRCGPPELGADVWQGNKPSSDFPNLQCAWLPLAMCASPPLDTAGCAQAHDSLMTTLCGRGLPYPALAESRQVSGTARHGLTHSLSSARVPRLQSRHACWPFAPLPVKGFGAGPKIGMVWRHQNVSF